MAVSKSFDIPIEARPAASPSARRSRLASSRSRANDPRAVSAVVPSAAIVIRPTTGIDRQAAIDSASFRICSGVQPCLLGSRGGIDLQADAGGSLEVLRGLVEGSQQLERVDRMDHPHHRQRFLDLVGLQVSNQVPADRIFEVRQGFGLPPELLRIVFAEVAGAASDQRPDPFDGLRFVTATRRTASARRPDRRAASAIRWTTASQLRRIRSWFMIVKDITGR